MNNLKANRAVWNTVVWAVRRAVYGAVEGAVDGVIWRAVTEAAERAMWGAVNWAVLKDPPHPALQDLLNEFEG